MTEGKVRGRLRAFYRHVHGNPSPHRGGQDVLLLLEHWPLWVYWAQVPPMQAAAIEARMLARFADALPAGTAHRLPFANRNRGRQHA
jgi:hypothetical protein